jgi:hypothetical protein
MWSRCLASLLSASALFAQTGFVENRGQWDERARFHLRASDLQAWVERDGWTVARGAGGSLRFRAVGARAGEPAGELPGPVQVACFVGAPSRWRSGLHAFARVRLRALWPGVDLVLRRGGGRLHYDLELAPGADAAAIRFACDGADAVRLERGRLRCDTPAGALLQSAPVAWCELPGGGIRPLRCAFDLREDRTWTFRLGAAPAGARVVIDPGLDWATYGGGRLEDQGVAIATLPDGDAIVTGTTLSTDFPTTVGAFDRTYNGSATQPRPIGDGFLQRLRARDGALVAATYFGGRENDNPVTVDVGSTGDVFVSGWTGSPDFPVTPGAFDTTFNGLGQGHLYGGGDLFALRIDPMLGQLRWASYVGGNDLEYVLSADVAPGDELTFSGHVHSPDFPTTPGAYSRSMAMWSDVFVTRIAADGSRLVFSTYFGGTTGEEYGMATAVAPDGTTTIAGATDASDLPTTPNAYDRSMNGGRRHLADGFVTRFDAAGSTLVYSTFLGGPDDDTAFAITLLRDGSALIGGETSSPQFPTTPDASDPTHGGKLDGFLVRLDAAGAKLLHGTFVGGAEDDAVRALVPDGGGGVIAGGRTLSPDFRTSAGAFQRFPRGSADAFVIRYDAALQIAHATLFGGGSWDDPQGISLARSGAIQLAGGTWSGDLPTTPGSAQPIMPGGGDAFAFQLDLLPSGLLRYGTAAAGCAGEPLAWGSPQPVVGEGAFQLACTRVEPARPGALLLGTPSSVALRIFGIDLWLDTGLPLLVLPAAASPEGGAALRLPIPSDPVWRGAMLGSQWVWADGCAASGLAASRALALLVQ